MIAKITEFKKTELKDKKAEKGITVPRVQELAKRRVNFSLADEEEQFCKLNRRELRTFAANPAKLEAQLKPKPSEPEYKPKINFFDLPCSLLDSVF